MSLDYTLCICSIYLLLHSAGLPSLRTVLTQDPEGLLVTKDLTLQKAAEAVLSMEAA